VLQEVCNWFGVILNNISSSKPGIDYKIVKLRELQWRV
jgi:hypothetical protein